MMHFPIKPCLTENKTAIVTASQDRAFYDWQNEKIEWLVQIF